MSKHLAFFVCLALAILSYNHCQAGRTKSDYQSRRNNYGLQQPLTPPTQSPALTPKEYLHKKSGFSTFGIISIIFVIIVGCLAFYYGIMCYPLLCRNEKRYNFMDVSSTISTTSHSLQSIDNYPDDQKHIEQKNIY